MTPRGAHDEPHVQHLGACELLWERNIRMLKLGAIVYKHRQTRTESSKQCKNKQSQNKEVAANQ